MAKEELKLTVAEARRQADVGRSLVRLDEVVMKKLGLKQGDIVEVVGTKSTGAIALKGYPEDRGLNIIRLDGLIRHNAGTSIGEKVTIRKSEVREAKSVTIAPTDPHVRFMAPGEVIRGNLLGRPVTKGDLLTPTPPEEPVHVDADTEFARLIGDFFGLRALPFGFGEVRFTVVNTTPSGTVLVTDMTRVEVLPEAVEVEKVRVPAVTYEDIGGLKDELQRVREMIELPLKHPELFDRLGIEPPKGVLLHGPPGCGKTLIAKAVANESGANFTSIAGPEVMCVAADTPLVLDGGIKTAAEVFTTQKTVPLGHGASHVSFGARGEILGIDNPSFTTFKTPLVEVTQVEVPYFYEVCLGRGRYEVSSNHPFLVLSEAGLIWKTPPMLQPGEHVVGVVIRELQPPGIELDAKNMAVPRIFTPGFASLLGMLAGDGYVSEDGITFCSKEAGLHQKFEQLMREHFKIDKFSEYRDGAGNVRTVVYSRELVRFLNRLGFATGKKNYISFLKNWLPRLDADSYAGFVLGLLATDGTITKFSVIVYSKDREALAEIARVGWSRGFFFSAPAKHKTPLGDVWKITLRGKYALREFGKICNHLGHDGPKPPKRSYEYVPAALLTQFKAAFRNARIKYGQDWTIEPYLNKRKRATLATMEKLLRLLKQKADAPADLIRCVERLVNGELWFDEIQDVRRRNEKKIMYDFGTRLSNFVTAFGHVMHNSKWYGESEARLREIFERAQKEAPSIVFIDELDAVAPKREEVTGEVERRVVATLCTALDGLKARGKVIVIGATNRPHALDPAIRRPGRFDREIVIGVPDRDGRKEILQIHTRGMPLAKDVDLDRYADITHGFVGADLEALCKEAAMSALRGILPEVKLEEEVIPAEVLEKLQVTKGDFDNALKMVEPSAMREVLVEVPNVHWEDIGGLEGAKQALREAVEWPLKYPDAFKRMGIEPPRGILLYGPPGSGKTLLARAVATESEANFISIKGPEMLSKWVGESERAVRETFHKARMAAPAIIFFDEIDAVVPRRGSGIGDAHVTERVISQMLTELDGLEKLENVVVLAATNRPDLIDPALLRPGRFDRLLLVPAPDKRARLEIFKIHTRGMPLAKDVSLERLAEETEGCVGSDIQAICREAAMMVLREDIKAKEVRMKHFREAMEKIRPTVTPEIAKGYEVFGEKVRKQLGEEVGRMHY